MDKLQYNDLKLDWLAFTYDDDNVDGSKFHRFMSRFPELELVGGHNCKQVYSHYEKTYYCGHDIFVYYDSEDSAQNKGCNCVIPAHSLEYACSLFGCSNARELIAHILNKGCTISRLDFCFDDFTKTFYPLNYFNWWQNGQFKTKFRVAHFDHGSDGGTTFALGNRAGLRYLRIYDKDIESKGEIKAIRYEFEFHSYTAQSLAESFVNNSGFSFRDFILQMFSITENTGKKQKCRENLLYEWISWVNNLKFNEEIIEIPVNMPAKNIEKSIHWFEVYVAKTLAKMFLLFGTDYIHETIEQACYRLSDIELDQITAAEKYTYKER